MTTLSQKSMSYLQWNLKRTFSMHIWPMIWLWLSWILISDWFKQITRKNIVNNVKMNMQSYAKYLRRFYGNSQKFHTLRRTFMNSQKSHVGTFLWNFKDAKNFPIYSNHLFKRTTWFQLNWLTTGFPLNDQTDSATNLHRVVTVCFFLPLVILLSFPIGDGTETYDPSPPGWE